jgi:hypothetical protein
MGISRTNYYQRPELPLTRIPPFKDGFPDGGTLGSASRTDIKDAMINTVMEIPADFLRD